MSAPLITALPGATSLDDDRLRIPLTTLGRLWELLAYSLPEGTAGLRVAESARLGSMPAWDYLLVNGVDLGDALSESLPYHRVVTAAEEHFTLTEVRIPELAEGQILVRNTWMSVDPYMRGRMDDAPSYIPPFELGAPLEGSAIGVVIASRADSIPVGAHVSHFLGWREHSVVDATGAVVVDIDPVPASAHLGPLGTTGLTAYLALTEIAPVNEGDTVYVSAAAGAVGSVAGQIARRLGAARVVGSAGGPEKTALLTTEFGYDAAIDRREGDLAKSLAEAAPDGIDVYLDSVGGDHLDAALEAMNPRGRVALVGAISGYNATGPLAGPDLYRAATKELSLRGMIVGHYLDRFPEFHSKAMPWLLDGTLRTRETVLDGLENATKAFFGVLDGANTGKMLVRL
ncbi:zinc-binding dehydrogenase [Nocardiopsis alba]|uniref:zinc-binding dehydrogenase n=2 Tax=Nocardiopsis alba TaxID=53437 RepID=UPI0033E4FCE7